MLHHAATRDEQWAGIPLPLDGEQLIIEETYPHREFLGQHFKREDEEDEPELSDEDKDWKLRNTFYSIHRRCEIIVMERISTGRVTYGLCPHIHSFEKQLHTLGCADAWGIEQEARALRLFGTLVRHRQFKQYMLTGSFLEHSPRSRVTYMFRRLRPTVAMHNVAGKMRILCTLCMHPIAYYANTWAGAMCPTDDVIAHLQLMRGDEAMFWRRSNQHAAWESASGI